MQVSVAVCAALASGVEPTATGQVAVAGWDNDQDRRPARSARRAGRGNVDLPDQQRQRRPVHRRPLPAQPAQPPSSRPTLERV